MPASPGLPLAFLAGLFTVGAPCILPMLPILLGASVGQRARARPAFIALGFALAFTSVAVIFSAATDALGLGHEALRNTAIALLACFGLLLLWPRPMHAFAAWMQARLGAVHAVADRAGSGNIGGLLLGATLGVLWTPCAGPVLGAILTLIATEDDPTRAAGLLLSYGLGAGLPMLLIAYGGQAITARVRILARHATRLQQSFGALIVATAIAMHFNYDSQIALWLSDFYPASGMGL